MSTYAGRIVERLREAEDDLRRDVDEQRVRWRYRMHRGRAWFDRDRHAAHRRLRQGVVAWIRHGSLLSLLSAPLVYSLLAPFVILDVWVTAYQWVCFPIYGIARVPRRRYLVLDRHRLAYLNGIEKVHCTFCSYANGLIAYVREVAARTEQYWCPIKHANAIPTPHSRYHEFFDYGDAQGYRADLQDLRGRLRPAHPTAGRTDQREHGHGAR